MLPPIPDAIARVAAAHTPLPVRRTERLVLRPWREADREPFAALNADPEVMAHFPAALSRAASDALLDTFRVQAARRGLGILAVEHRETRQFMGMTGLWVPSWDAPFTPCVELSWRFARPWWGQGYALEAARDVIAWGFGPLALPRLLAWTAVTNRRSWGLMERLGMSEIGVFDHPKVEADHPLRPHVMYAIEPARAEVAPADGEAAPVVPPAPRLPKVWIDGDGSPRVVKDIVWRAVERGAIDVTLVANRAMMVPRHRNIHAVVVSKGLDVADEWLVAHAHAQDLVITSDIPLAAELVTRGVAVVSPRGEWFTPANIGEKLSVRDFFTEARASGMIEGGGPAEFDERAKRAFANALDGWIARRRLVPHA